MKTFKEIIVDYRDSARYFGGPAPVDDCSMTDLRLFAEWLDQRYAPAALPGGAQPEGPTPAVASTVPAADNGGDVSFLQWIHDRLEHVHHENPNVDYMLKLQRLADNDSTVDNNGGGDSFPVCKFPDGVVLHFSYEQVQNDRQLTLALSNLMFGLIPKDRE